MDTSTDLAITFFTILTLLANVATLAIVGLAAVTALAWRRSRRPDTSRDAIPAPERWWRMLRRDLSPAGAVGLAWLVAAVSMGGSLFFSMSAGFVPCRLCWYQRGFMYPLVGLLALAGVAVYQRGGSAVAVWVRRVGMAAAVAGAGVAAWHLLIERFPSLESTTSCDLSNPCSFIWFERLGFITLPYMSFSGFTLIFTLLAFAGTGDASRARSSSPNLKESPV